MCSQSISVSHQEENHQEELEMMFDKNGRQEEISLHYKNKERESLHKKIE